MTASRAHREMAAFTAFVREILKDRSCVTHHLDLIECACRKSEQRPADPIALGVALLANVAERDHGLDEMKSRAVVQADALAQFRQRDAVARKCDFLKNEKCATDRLDSATLLTLVD